ncbi:transketolase-like TK C-terminal-containing protein [Methylobacterium sp. J-067]|uniref:transketolase-like TK C-terminal-containing protein n=1 Tax=Methylobacterium sp. J-067 TaxID=2836648 RepID=UPI001FB91BAA|nr:1-deoxy-D-xylulose-5-phosphate synthase N-terminal domain-containing protein [Methylobacterium sp. J-067]MCJ2025927.1 transketolase [Methylobacterium sp. J-067]
MSPAISPEATHADPRLPFLGELERRALWLSTWMIHNANHIRPNHDGMKVGGHQASSASMATILTALYFAALRPEDRVAVKPHAGPVFHALQYLAGRQTREKMENFRGFGGVQSYPSRTKDTDDVDFSTGSVGLGVAQTLFGSLVQDYVRAHGWGLDKPEGRMVALVGDAEMDEGNIFEALMEGWKHGLRRTWWIIDYNRQSLDAVIREGLYSRFEEIFRSFGWDVVVLKYGCLMDAAFAEPGGESLRRWIDTAPNQLYAALTFQGGAAWRKRLNQDLANEPDALALVARRDDDELAALMGNLGGHDMVNLLKAFEAADNDRPTVFIAYTVKGYGLPLAGHKDNHSGLLTPAQTELFREKVGVRAGHEWEPFEGAQMPEADLRRFIEHSPFFSAGPRRYSAPKLPVPADFPCPRQPSLSTQAGFGLILNELGKQETPLAERIVTTSPDVTVSTNLGGWVNRRGLFAKQEMRDLFKSERIPSTFNWDFSTKGQHMELGIAEMNLFLLLSALGLSDRLFGERLIPIGTLYDPFICRGLDALNYACYQDARFIIGSTPSGVTLAPEGGAHQSINTPLIGMAQDGLLTFEPAFVDELSVIMGHAFDYVQRDGKEGGSVYLRLSTRSLAQPQREMSPALKHGIIEGAYWLREPGPNADLIVAVTGAPTPEAIEAVGLMAEDRRDIGLLAVTSYDRLNAGWSAAQRARESGDREARSHIEDLLDGLPPHCRLVTVVDGHPATLGWLGAVHGHRTRALGIERFGQTGTVADLYRHYGIDAEGIVAAAGALSPEKPIRSRGYGHRIGRGTPFHA